MSDENVPNIPFRTPDSGEQMEVLVEGIDEIPEQEEVESKLPDDFKELSKEEIYAKYQQSTEGVNQAQALQAGIEALGDKLTPQQQQAAPVPQQQQQPAPVTPEEQEAKNDQLTDMFFKEPTKAFDQAFDAAIDAKIGPLMRDTISSNFSTQRQILETNPDKKEFFQKHAAEIDAEFQKLPLSDRVVGKGYTKAYDNVRAQNLDEVIDSEVAKRMESIKAELKAELAPQRGVEYTETGGTAPRVVKRKRVILTREDKAKADAVGMTYNDYAVWKEGRNG
jgi:hypothetical protein